jgi:arylsulfatase
MSPTQPNLIFLMPDQLRHDFLSCYGADFIQTPHIDSLAEQGIRYNRAYSVSPICVPARALLLTGMNAIKNGVTDNGQWLRPDMGEMGIRTWPEMLADAGYYTAAIGKMHFYPWDIKHGFQYRIAAEDKRWIHVRDQYYHFLKDNDLRKLHGNEHEGYYDQRGAIINRLPWEYSVDHFVGQEACHFIRNYGQDGPFAMMVGFPGPHCPYDPNLEFMEGIDPEAMPPAIPEVPGAAPKLRQGNIDGNRRPWNGVDYTEFTNAHKQRIRAHYAGLVKQIDYEVGKILEALQEQGLLEKSIVIFASDHGDYLGDHNFIGKGTFYEGSIHVPLIVRLPEAVRATLGQAGAAVTDELVELGDVTATLLHLGGCTIPDYMDSIPLPGLGASRRERPYSIGMVSNGWMIYDGRWKLTKYATGEVLFFDLEQDPHEQQNLLHQPEHFARFLEFDSVLTQAIMHSITVSHYDRRVYESDLSQNPAFGREGWQRTYPQRFNQAP